MCVPTVFSAGTYVPQQSWSKKGNKSTNSNLLSTNPEMQINDNIKEPNHQSQQTECIKKT